MESRRSFLATCAGAAAAGLAGCLEIRRRYNDDTAIISASIEKLESVGASSNQPILTDRTTEGGVTTLTIQGFVTGRNGCFDDVSLTTDTEEETTPTLTVAPVQSNSKRRVCTEALVQIGYELTVKYEGTLDSVTVTHRGLRDGTFDIDLNEQE